MWRGVWRGVWRERRVCVEGCVEREEWCVVDVWRERSGVWRSNRKDAAFGRQQNTIDIFSSSSDLLRTEICTADSLKSY